MGDCYQANGSYLLNQSYTGKSGGMILVHGVAILTSDGKPFGHCWIEKGNTVYDFSNGKNLKGSKKVYYKLGGIPVKGYKNHKYKIKDVRKKVLQTGHWGPWDSKPPRQEIVMRKFPIDSRNEIGKKRVKVPSMMINKMEEQLLREKIREIIKKIR